MSVPDPKQIPTLISASYLYKVGKCNTCGCWRYRFDGNRASHFTGMPIPRADSNSGTWVRKCLLLGTRSPIIYIASVSPIDIFWSQKLYLRPFPQNATMPTAIIEEPKVSFPIVSSVLPLMAWFLYLLIIDLTPFWMETNRSKLSVLRNYTMHSTTLDGFT